MTATPQPLAAAQDPLPHELVPDAPEPAHVAAWWRASNDLTIGQIYLKQNPLLRQPSTPDDIKHSGLRHRPTIELRNSPTLDMPQSRSGA